MNHYARLATLSFRALAVVLLGYALFTTLILARLAAGMGSSVMLLPGLGSLVIAILLYVAAPVLGRFAAARLAPAAAPPHER